MNILDQLNFTSSKPTTHVIHKSEVAKYVAVGLLKGQELQKHKTAIPTLLTVLKGSIEFSIDNKVLVFNELDTYEIPVNVEHEVKGINDQNIFTLIQEKGKRLTSQGILF